MSLAASSHQRRGKANSANKTSSAAMCSSGREAPSPAARRKAYDDHASDDECHIERRPKRSAYGNLRNIRAHALTLLIGLCLGYLCLPLIMGKAGSLSGYTSSSTVKSKESSTVLHGPNFYSGGYNEEPAWKKVMDKNYFTTADDDSPPLWKKEQMSIQNSQAEDRLEESMGAMEGRSFPTHTTPQVFRTARLPDHKRKKILVTGGAGFVGSHLVDKLMVEGHEVIVLDNFFTGNKRNVEHWLKHPNFSLRVHDVIEPIELEIDQIYHLACPASPPHYMYNPVKTIKTSTQGTLNMLGLAKRTKARILLASTSEIYGDPKVNPQTESYWGNVNTIGPRACYDEGKRVAETMMYSYRNQASATEIRVARIFNTFGPRMHPNDGRVVSNFIIQALQNKNMTIYGHGQQTRSFQYVSDLVDGLHSLMNSDYDNPVNLGNPDEYTVNDFALRIKYMTNSAADIIHFPKSEDDPQQRKPDITTARQQLGWQPRVPVEEGLKRTIRYFKRVLEDEGEIIPTGPGASKPKHGSQNEGSGRYLRRFLF